MWRFSIQYCNIDLSISNNFYLSIPRKLFINEEEFMVAHDTDDNKVVYSQNRLQNIYY